MQEKRPGDANLDLISDRGWILRLKAQRPAAEVAGDPMSQVAAFPARKAQLQLALEALQRPAVPRDHVLVASYDHNPNIGSYAVVV